MPDTNHGPSNGAHLPHAVVGEASAPIRRRSKEQADMIIKLRNYSPAAPDEFCECDCCQGWSHRARAIREAAGELVLGLQVQFENLAEHCRDRAGNREAAVWDEAARLAERAGVTVDGWR